MSAGEREGWQRVEELFDRVADLARDERAELLDRECGEDSELRAQVEALLEADERGEGFLEAPIAEAAPTLLGEIAAASGGTQAGGPEPSARRDPEATEIYADEPARDSSLPPVIGRYEIVGKLGEGGMGVVYEAEQQQPRRRVALKVIRGGQFVGEDQIKMFQREADTLARLKHPNIGGIYEAGRTEDGQHFFAMELVRGETLADFLARGSGPLSDPEVDSRLDLFRSIADAVHYAHQRGVIHRDLKPGNIIVTEERADNSDPGSGLPKIKILDFGLARMTEVDVAAATMVTEVGAIKGTLPYMSPEQARGNPEELDLRTDVYALGVILYEMLTEQRPYDLEGSLVEAVRVICETPPRPLRTAWRGVRKVDPDLETIVGKALEKDADRRYASAFALSEDVGRFQAKQPILARPPSTMYQLQKLVARNRLGTGFAATLLALLIGFGIWMNILWRRSEVQRARAEAASVLTLGRFEIEESPSSALAYALRSIEISDSPAARRFALEALWRGPPARVIYREPGVAPEFSPDGRYLAIDGADFEAVKSRLVLFASEGGEPLEIERMPPKPALLSAFDAESQRLFTARLNGPLRSWSLPDGEPLASREVEEETAFLGASDGQTLISLTATGDDRSLVRAWPMDGGAPTVLGHIEGWPFFDVFVFADHDPEESTLVHVVDGQIFVRSLADLGAVVRPVGRHGTGWGHVFLNPDRMIVGSALPGRAEVRLWSLDRGSPGLIRSLAFEPLGQPSPVFDPSGRYLAAGGLEGTMWFWDLEAPPDAQPIALRQSDQQHVLGLAFHPESSWLVTGDNARAVLWPIDRYALELRGHDAPVTSLIFDPEGRWLASTASLEVEARIWPLEGDESGSVLDDAGGRSLAVDPSGKRVLAAFDEEGHGVSLVSVDGSESRLLGSEDSWCVAFSPDGRYAVGTGGQWVPEVAVVTVWDLETGETFELDAGDDKFVVDAVFLGPHRLAASGTSGLRVWDLASRTSETLSESPGAYVAATADGETLLRLDGPGTWAAQGGVVRIYDLASGESRKLSSHGDRVVDVVVDPEGKLVVTGDADGVVRVGPLSGEEPHLLLGHDGIVHAVAIDPRGRWIASGGADAVIRLWPIPEGQPFHTLPRDEVLDRLRSLTNYRVVADESTPDGYRLEIGPFPGWESRPTW